MKHVVNFSGGLCSFFAAKRVVEEFGPEDVTLLFADTMMEDPDLYRFLDDCSAHLGIPVTRIADGRTPWQVFFDERYLGNSRIDPCSKILKRKLLDRWHLEHCELGGTVIYVGLSWDENRLENFQARMSPWTVRAPMCDAPYHDKAALVTMARFLGIKPPALYDEGFPHNNCGGFCVKAGQAQFALLLRTHPDRYAYHEAKEHDIREFLGKDVSILRDRRGGTVKTLTLKELRERIETDQAFDDLDWGGCGCAV